MDESALRKEYEQAQADLKEAWDAVEMALMVHSAVEEKYAAVLEHFKHQETAGAQPSLRLKLRQARQKIDEGSVEYAELAQAESIAQYQRSLENAWGGERRKRRVITTARTYAAINAAAKRGLRPLLKAVEASEEIWSRVMVFQDPDTGEIEESGDFRHWPEGKKQVLSVEYYPYSFPNPYAAYLVPPDLQPGEEVWLADLIEDRVGSHWNQGPTSRLVSCEAVWNGEDFEVQYDPRQHRAEMIG